MVDKCFYDEADYTGMSSYLAGFAWFNQLQNLTVEEMKTLIHSIISTTVDTFVPLKTFRTGNHHRQKAVWINNNAFAKLKKKKAFQRYLCTN